MDGQNAVLAEARDGRQLATLQSPEPENVLALAFSPDCTRLAASKGNSRIEIWDLALIRRELAAMGLDWDAPPYPGGSAQN